MNKNLLDILKLHDAGRHVPEIADNLGISKTYIYEQLREHRPERERKPTEPWSDKPAQIVALFNKGVRPALIAERLGISRQYVYRCLPDRE